MNHSSSLKKPLTTKLFPIIIFLVAFSFLSFNISNHGLTADERLYNASGVVFFDLAAKGDFLNPCWNGQGICEQLCLTECWEEGNWSARQGGSIKSLIVGLGYFLMGEEGTNAYQWSANMPFDPEGALPDHDELEAGRLFSPLLGSLTIVIAYFVGSMLFNRFTGACFSITLLFHSLWLWHSRTTMTEVFLGFFIISSIFLLLYSLKEKNSIKFKYFILSAIVFAIAVNTKLPSAELIPLFVLIIFFRTSWTEKFSLSRIKNKKFILKSLGLILLFTAVFVPTVFLTEPFYYINPISQLQFFEESVYKFRFLHPPWEDDKPHIRLLGAFSATVLPIMDYYYHNFAPEDTPDTGTGGTSTTGTGGGNTVISTWSSIPLTLFLILGIIFLFYSIKKRTLQISEFLLLIWFFSVYILTAITLDSYNVGRHFFVLLIPMILIASYGLSRFISNESNLKAKIIFVSIFIISHAITILAFSDLIYYSPGFIWPTPLPFSLQASLEFPIVSILGIVFLITFGIFAIRKLVLFKKTTQPSS